MSVIIASLLILLIAFALAVLMRRKLAETVLLSATAVILLLFVAGMLHKIGSLRVGLGAIIFIACCSLAYIVFSFIKDRGSVAASEPIQGILIYALFLLLSLYICYGLSCIYDDEYTVWGIGVRAMHFTDALYTVPTDYITGKEFVVPFNTYIPGTVLWGYFFGRFQPLFDESIAFVANAMLGFTFLMPLVKDAFKKGKTLCCVVFTVFVLLAQYCFDFNVIPFCTLFVDIILGVMFGLALLNIFNSDYGTSFYSVVFASCATFWLTITKQMGLTLAAGICFVILVEMFIKCEQLFSGLKNKLQAAVVMAGLLFPPAISALGINFVWSIYLKIHNIQPISPLYKRFPAITDVLHLLTMNFNDIEQQSFNGFMQTILGPVCIPPLSYPVVLTFFLFAGILLAFLLKRTDSIKSKVVFIISSFIACIFYQFCLLLAYMTSFLGHGTGSLGRYTSTGVLGMLLVASVAIFPLECDLSIQSVFLSIKTAFTDFRNGTINRRAVGLTYAKKTLALLLVTVSLIGLTAANNGRGSRLFRNYLITARTRTWLYNESRPESKADKWVPVMQELSAMAQPKAIIIAQTPRGRNSFLWIQLMSFFPFVDACAPAGTDVWVPIGWGYKEELNVDENGSEWNRQLDISPDDLEKLILTQDAEFLYIYIADDNLRSDYERLFPDGAEDDMLYRIIRDGESVRFIKI